ncbi:tRNA pseudouridine(55) synthase TruB [Bifidobacterium pullorum]|uniref:tRNA pseudouridine(55) synthase TruB n=1 Tax=Bifidobacterium pullorum TaxID=78448 RepID=UPI0025A3ECA4|nr:tRNA pseudouridine(55) synthase TruB [Bifidobacterium pullorum]MDM8322396.1 tRNA pseudouridine(55) synthase TruB [Bifidobacterium pullorum]
MTDSGLLIVDKPQGVTSHDIVAAVRGALHMKRVGHAGTLDPMATGVLVVGFGNATRLLNVIVEHDKTYEATIRLGQRTTTDDADGEIVSTRPAPAMSREALQAVVDARFTGTIEQVPNTYSAIKINGQRAYDLARDGQEVRLKARPVTIHEFAVLDARPVLVATAAGEQSGGSSEGRTPGDDESRDGSVPVLDVDVRVACSAGTYIRALARDLGEALGVGGHLTRLRRIRVGRYRAEDPRTVTAHTEQRTFTTRDGETVTRSRAVLDVSGDELAARALPMVEAASAAMPVIEVSDVEAADLRFGRRIRVAGTTPRGGRLAAVVPERHDLVAIVEPCGHGMAKPVTVFPVE